MTTAKSIAYELRTTGHVAVDTAVTKDGETERILANLVFPVFTEVFWKKQVNWEQNELVVCLWTQELSQRSSERPTYDTKKSARCPIHGLFPREAGKRPIAQ